MARAPIDTNGVDLDTTAPPSAGDVVNVGDPSGDGHIIDTGDEDNDSWDKPKTPPARLPEAADDGDYDEEDSRLAYTDADDFPERETKAQRGKRSQRNARRAQMREAANAEIEALRGALEEQGKVIKSLVTGQSSIAVNTVASEISQLEGALRIASEEKAAAVKSNDGDTYAKAEGIRDRIIERLSLLRAQKTQMDAMVSQQGDDAPQRQQQQPQRQQVDPRIVQAVESHFDRFSERFPWFDPESRDADSNIVRALDQELIGEGYQRHTPAFWQQLERKMATRYKLVPTRGEDADDEQDEPPVRQERRSPAMSRGGSRPPTSNGRGNPNGRTGFHLNEHQTSMLRDEGLIGDNLSKEDAAKRDRIVNKWRTGMESMRRTGAR